MKLSNLKFWHTDPAPTLTSTNVQPQHQQPQRCNVVQLPLSATEEESPDIENALTSLGHSANLSRQNRADPSGPMSSPEIKTFFDRNVFGLGRHDGSHYKTQDALDLGKALVISQFQNAVAAAIDQKQAKVDQLRNVEVQTEGVCSTTSAQLRQACARLERDMSALRNQAELAAEGQGWVLSALNEYQTGFGKGVREAINAELLGL
jgi:hypothetical protein